MDDMRDTIPHRYSLRMLNALVESLKQLGGSGLKAEIVEATGSKLGLSRKQLDFRLEPSDYSTYLSGELNWTRWAMGKSGLIDIPRRGTWQLTKSGWQIDKITEPIREKILKTKNEYRKDQALRKKKAKARGQTKHNQ